MFLRFIRFPTAVRCLRILGLLLQRPHNVFGKEKSDGKMWGDVIILFSSKRNLGLYLPIHQVYMPLVLKISFSVSNRRWLCVFDWRYQISRSKMSYSIWILYIQDLISVVSRSAYKALINLWQSIQVGCWHLKEKVSQGSQYSVIFFAMFKT